jgi:hypothetical protein
MGSTSNSEFISDKHGAGLNKDTLTKIWLASLAYRPMERFLEGVELRMVFAKRQQFFNLFRNQNDIFNSNNAV